MCADIVSAPGRVLLGERHADGAALRCELQCVGEEVQQHLIEPHAVAVHLLGLDVLNEDVEGLLLGLHLRLDDIDDILRHLPQGQQIHVQCQLAAFDLGHVQHVVDEAQQVLAGEGDLVEAVPHLGGLVDVGGGNGCHAHNGVHGSADVVAHVGEEFALGLVSPLRLPLGFFQTGQLLLGHAEVQVKDQQQRRNNHRTAAQSGVNMLIAQACHCLVQRAVEHHRHQVPLGIGQRGTVDVPALAVHAQRGGILLSPADGFLQRGDRRFGSLVLEGASPQQPVIVGAAGVVGVFHHEGAVLMDDMGIDEGVVYVQGHGLVDILDGDTGYQGRAVAPVPHGIALGGGVAHGDPQQKQPLAAFGDAQRHLLFRLVQGCEEGVLVQNGDGVAVEDVRVSVLGVEGQIEEVPGDGAGGQFLTHFLIVGGHGFRRRAPDDAFHLGELQIDNGAEVQLQLMVHLLHIDLAHPVDGLVALPDHIGGDPDKDAHTQGQDADQADPQKAGVFLFHGFAESSCC
ncbi:putative uncharacterized protein [Oscillibacter sp. CAG:155]|nr:putative uncharacterized protein [Oscillibacter sp. CAG:155]